VVVVDAVSYTHTQHISSHPPSDRHTITYLIIVEHAGLKFYIVNNVQVLDWLLKNQTEYVLQYVTVF